jgi:hypothetical protein
MQCFSLLFFVVSSITAVASIDRLGRCPAPQFVSSGLSCSSEGDDSPCPENYKCCPLINGMKCFEACPAFSEPCNLQCPFGLKVVTSPCTSCECAPDPCLSTQCALGTKCISQPYSPCAISGRCGFSTQCINDPSIHVDPTPKPKQCPSYWPSMGMGLRTCRGPDALCPGEQKCCQGPTNQFYPSNQPDGYCVEPCDDMAKCTLQCPYQYAIEGGCTVCRCEPHPCERLSCPPEQTCQLIPTPCAYFPGRPPCPMHAMCLNKNQLFPY